MLTAVCLGHSHAGVTLCRCVLCHQEQHQDAGEFLLAQRQITRTPEGVTNRALGPLLLVRVSAISNAWVHMQCALWSGEVTLLSWRLISKGESSDIIIIGRKTRNSCCLQCG